MHCWGDDWFKEHGHKLEEAISYCTKTWRTYGRICTNSKEKYGTFRDCAHPYYAHWAIHELLKPGYVYYRWNRKIGKLDVKLGKIFRFFRIDVIVRAWQRIVYNYAIQKMCKKYPEIIDEIVSDLDLYYWVKPGIFGSVDGKEIHDKYWK